MQSRGQFTQGDVNLVIAGREVKVDVLFIGSTLQRRGGERLSRSEMSGRQGSRWQHLVHKRELVDNIAIRIKQCTLHGEVTHQTDHLGGIYHCISAAGNRRGIGSDAPHAQLIDVTREEACIHFLRVHSAPCRANVKIITLGSGNQLLGHGLYSFAVNIGYGAQATSHVECQVVPIAVTVIHIAEEITGAIGNERGLLPLTEGAQFQTSGFIEAQPDVIDDGEQRRLMIGVRLTTEPHLDEITVGRA